MRSFIATTAVALAASSVVSAAPSWHHNRKHYNNSQSSATATGTGSSSTGIIQLPLGDGFPNLKKGDAEVNVIQKEAFGTLSNAKGAPLSDDTLTSVRFVAFNELFESDFFANFVANMSSAEFTKTLPPGVSQEFALDTLKSILAVEELHALNANFALTANNQTTIEACKYKFPGVEDFESAISLANRFTDVVLGTLQDVIVDAAKSGDANFTAGVAASLGDEGEQDGWFRTVLGERPQSQPFETRSVRDYAFSILQDFIVPGSCPNIDLLTADLTVFQPLLATDPPAKNVEIEFSFDLIPQRPVYSNAKKPQAYTDFKAKYEHHWQNGALTISYLNGQNIPVSVPLKSLKLDGTVFTATADFPQEENLFFGLVLAALTVGDGFQSAQDMVDATLFGPAPLEVQENGQKSSDNHWKGY